MTRRRATFVARRRHSVDADWIEIGLFIAGSLLVAFLLAGILLSVVAGYMR